MERRFDAVVAFVSDQRMQNVIPFYQRGIEVQQMILVVSQHGNQKNQRFEAVAQDLRAAFEDAALARCDMTVDIAETPMPPFDFHAIRSYLAELFERRGLSQVLLNITGGTKLMSIGAYSMLRELGATAVYVDSAERQLIWFEPDGRIHSEPFNLSPITVATYLMAHGRAIDHVQTANHGPKIEQLAIFHILPDRFKQLNLAFGTIRRAVRQRCLELPVADCLPIEVPLDGACELDNDVKHALSVAGLFGIGADSLWIDRSDWRFLNGGWLEVFVYLTLKDSGKFNDVQCNVHLTGVANELDVVCTLDGRIALIECKAGRLLAETKRDANAQIARERRQAMLDRLQVVADKAGGVFSRRFLVSSLRAEDILDSFKDRAAKYEIDIVTRGKLSRIDALVYDALVRNV